MANTSNGSVDNNEESPKETGSDKSFVGKFVSGLISNTPLSKWFSRDSAPNSVVRRRGDEDDDDEEDASMVQQPPMKRVKPSEDASGYRNSRFFLPPTVHGPVSGNNVTSSSGKFAAGSSGNFPEPVAGPSGVSARQLLFTTMHNSYSTVSSVVNDSESEESNCGYGSENLTGVRSKMVKDTSGGASGADKSMRGTSPRGRSLFSPSFEQHSRSLFGDRSLSPQASTNTSLSSRRPAFNASSFGSPSFADRTLTTKRILNSPFYNGNTGYGGASAYSRRLAAAHNLSTSTQGAADQSVRSTIQIKPKAEKKSTGENTTMSKTARRILSALEQYSTPIGDAKKIPVSAKRQGILTKYIGANPYGRVGEKRAPPNRELQVPTVPELIHMKQRERLQNSTEAVRQIAVSSSKPKEYSLRSEDGGKEHKQHSNKMKSTTGRTARRRVDAEETMAEVVLPQVSLPMTSFPKIDFVLKPPDTKVLTEPDKLNSNKISFSTSTSVDSDSSSRSRNDRLSSDKPTYKFSKPIVISTSKVTSSVNCFKFSEPSAENLGGPKDSPAIQFKMPEKRHTPPKSRVRNNGETKLVAGSVMDVLGANKSLNNNDYNVGRTTAGFGDKFKLASDQWECPACMIRNDNKATDCAACATPRVRSTTNQSFGASFKPPSDSWECPSCMVRNKSGAGSCVACTTSRPAAAKSSNQSWGTSFKAPADSWECPSCMVPNKSEAGSCVACTTSRPATVKSSNQSWGTSFKAPADSWECPSCMVRNKSEAGSCVACTTSRPAAVKSSWGTSFKPPSDSWECPSCMVRNKNGAGSCVACTTSRPSAVKSANQGDWGASFKAPADSWECPSCMIRNKSEVSSCAACTASRPAAVKSSNQSFGTSFKSPADTWECPSCMIRNKNDLSKCAACETGKPMSKLTFAPPKDDWECPGCTIRNLDSATTCAGCQNARPNCLSSNNNIYNNSKSSSGFGSSFAMKQGEWECSACMVRNRPDLKDCNCCGAPRPGAVKVATVMKDRKELNLANYGAPMQFNFGIPKSFENKENTAGNAAAAPPVLSFGDGAKLPVATTSTPSFTFGFRPEAAVSVAGTAATVASGVANPLSKSGERVPDKAEVAPLGFSFTAAAQATTVATSKTSAAPITTTPVKPTFEFKPSAQFTPVNGSAPSNTTPVLNKSDETATITTGDAPKVNSTGAATSIFGTPSASAAADTSKSGAAPMFKYGESFAPAPLINKRPFEPTGNSSSVANGFGSPAKVPTFSFGSTSAAATTVVASAASNSAPVFSFGSSAPALPAPSGFNFSLTAVPSTGFNFGGGAAAMSSTSDASAKGGDSTNAGPVVFGAATAKNGTTPTFNFGSGAVNNNNNNNGNNAQKAVLSFGQSLGTLGQSRQANFGMMGAPGGSATFTFGAAAAPAAPSNPGTFSFGGAPPSFNFTDGTSGAPGQQQRKIRKALRRTHR